MSKYNKLPPVTVAKSRIRKINKVGRLPYGSQSGDVTDWNTDTRPIATHNLYVAARHQACYGTHPQSDSTLKKCSPVVRSEACMERIRVGEEAHMIVKMAHMH